MTTLVEIAREWGRIGVIGFGGPPAHIRLLRETVVERRGWVEPEEFEDALGQITPGPVVHIVAVVGFAAAGLLGALGAAVIAFGPSFVMIVAGGRHFEALRSSPLARAFLDGAGPAAIGAILGSAVPLALATSEWWQWVVLAAAGVLLLLLKRGVVLTLLLAAGVGVVVALSGGPLP